MTSLVRPWFLILSLGLASGAGAQNVTVDATNSPYVVAGPATFAQLTVATGGVLMANSPVTVSGDLSVLAGGLVTVNPAVSNTVRLTVAGALKVNVGGRHRPHRQGAGGPDDHQPGDRRRHPLRRV